MRNREIWLVVELCVWNLYNFVTQCHPSKFNKKEENGVGEEEMWLTRARAFKEGKRESEGFEEGMVWCVAVGGRGG